MAEIASSQPDGTQRTVDTAEGTSVMRTALDAWLPGIVGECGGQLKCVTCHCFADGPLGEGAEIIGDEEDMLECTAVEREPSSRLTCQLVAEVKPSPDGSALGW